MGRLPVHKPATFLHVHILPEADGIPTQATERTTKRDGPSGSTSVLYVEVHWSESRSQRQLS